MTSREGGDRVDSSKLVIVQSRRPSKLRRGLVKLVVCLVLLVNLSAMLQARAMTNFVEHGTRTPDPEALSVFDAAKAIVWGVTIPRPQDRRTPKAFGLGFERLVYKTSRGNRLEAWRIAGAESKPLILAFHGYASSKSSLLPVAAVFHQLGYDVLVVDRPDRPI